MERKLHQEPVFDFETLRQKCDAWLNNGAKRVVMEWSTGIGPTVFYYPAGERRLGVKWTVAVETYNYNEIYADYIERALIPKMREAVEARRLETSVLCVDLQPLQVQRLRRRHIERSEEHSGVAAAHH